MNLRVFVPALLSGWLCSFAWGAAPEDGVSIITDQVAVRLVPFSPGTIRVEIAPGKTLPEKQSLAVISRPDPTGWRETEDAGSVQLTSAKLRAVVDKQSGRVSFYDAAGKTLLEQKTCSFQPARDSARDGLQVNTTFGRAPGEHYYGGGVIGGDLRKPDAEIDFSNNNTQIRVPVLYSSVGYGLFWDNSGRSRLKLANQQLTWSSSAGDLADFYVMAGPNADQAVAEYRALTGAAPLFPLWAYGFWFCKNKFNSQQEILAAAKAFRDHQFPIDLLVQDYYFWKPNGAANDGTDWGSHQFTPDRYPDPKAMVAELHDQDHLHFMAVVWPKFDPATDHAKELQAAGNLFPATGSGSGALPFYDPYDPKGREIYGRQVMDSFQPLGVDAIWMDAAEPEIPNDVFARFNTKTGIPVSRVMDAFPLMHTTAMYAAHRARTDQKRAVLLPRSAWAGEQRNAAANWTGDIRSDWSTLAWQIEGLQNYSVAGLPYITTDIGGYSPGPVSEADTELFLRWFQWGTFCPVYRVHGVSRAFPWQYGPGAEAIMNKFDRLRYRLLPYIYSQAGRVTREGGTLMRPLVMDFQDDPEALDTWDEFLFGPSLLVCPVYQSTRERVGTVDQWSDLQGKTGGVTATFLSGGDESDAAREDLQDAKTGFRFKADAANEQRTAKRVRIEGTFTPDRDGKLEWEFANGMPKTLTLDGTTVNPDIAAASFVFGAFPLDGKAGVPIRFAFESSDRCPGFRMVRPATGPSHRDVYLPGRGAWYDFWTGQRVADAERVNVEAPLERIPLYVRAGSILPMGPERQYAAEKPADPIELRVYRGANGVCTLYEDEGDNYDYEKGVFAEISMGWDDRSQTLTLGERKGSFPGMLARRTFRIVWVDSAHGVGEPVTPQADAEILYDGREVSIKPSAR